MTARINHVAVIVGAIVYFVWGAIWYTLFGNVWGALTGVTTTAPTTYVISFLIGFPLAYTIAYVLRGVRDPDGWRGGAVLGAVLGVGVWATNLLEGDAYLMHPLGLWAIDAGYGVIGMAIVGAIIGGWRAKA
jgi:hypothetical protein